TRASVSWRSVSAAESASGAEMARARARAARRRERGMGREGRTGGEREAGDAAAAEAAGFLARGILPWLVRRRRLACAPIRRMAGWGLQLILVLVLVLVLGPRSVVPWRAAQS